MATYDSFASNWSRRLSDLARAGADESQILRLKSIVQQDYQKLERGEEPMDNVTATAAMITALRNKPTIKQPSNPSGVLNVLGNIPKDLASIVTSIPKIPGALYQEGKDIASLLQGEYEVPDQGNPLRNIAATPGLRLIPGVMTGAALTTPEGRESILQAPVTHTLDILPVTGAAAKFGAVAAESAGLVSRPQVVAKLALRQEALKAGKTRLIPTTDRLTRAEAIYAAAAEGKPVGMVLAASGLKPLMDASTNPAVTWLNSGLKLSRDLSSSHAAILRTAQRDLNAVNTHLNELFAKMPVEDRTHLAKVLQHPDKFSPTTPEMQTMVDTVRDWQRVLGEKGESKGGLFGLTLDIGGKQRKFFYAESTPIKSAISKFNTWNDTYARRITELDEANTNWAAVNEWTNPHDKLKLAQKRVQAEKNLTKAKSELLASRKAMWETIVTNAPREYHPMLKSRITEAAHDAIIGDYRSGAITKPDFERAIERFRSGEFEDYLGKKRFNDIVDDVQRTWIDLAKTFEPVFLHNVPDFMAGARTRAKVVVTYPYKPGQFKPVSVGEMSPHYGDVAVALSAGEAEYLQQAANREFMNRHVPRLGKTFDDVEMEHAGEIQKLMSKGKTKQKAVDEVLSRYYVRIANADDIDHAAFKAAWANSHMAGQTLYFDKHTYSVMKAITAGGELSRQIPGHKALEKSTNALKASLFTLSPRHFADETFGNLVLLALRSPKEVFSPSTIKSAVEMWKGKTLDSRVSVGIDVVPTDQILSFSKGKTLGRIFKTTGAVARATEFVNGVQKSMALIGAEKHALKQGLSPEMAREVGIRFANKALVDFDSMTPVERVIVRQVFPFYSWIRFQWEYLKSYPHDHPLRAAFISRFASMESEDEATGLPKYFRNVFRFGDTDAEGNFTAVDLRVLNPLRDAGNLMTWAGFISALNPLLEVPFSATGVDTLAAAPEMFPELTVNPQTGRLESKRPSITSKSGAMELIGQFIPPAAAIDHFIGFTDRIKRLRDTDPIAYRRQLFSALGIPMIPYQESVPKAQTRQQKALVEAARGAVSRSTRQNGSTRDLRRYPVVPWQGMVVPGESLANLIDRLHSVSNSTGIPVRMLMDEVAKAVK